jgi:hypothetical protein
MSGPTIKADHRVDHDGRRLSAVRRHDLPNRLTAWPRPEILEVTPAGSQPALVLHEQLVTAMAIKVADLQGHQTGRAQFATGTLVALRVEDQDVS